VAGAIRVGDDFLAMEEAIVFLSRFVHLQQGAKSNDTSNDTFHLKMEQLSNGLFNLLLLVIASLLYALYYVY